MICAGGTGGHVYPALAAVDRLQKARAALGGVQLLWVGSIGGMERKMVSEVGISMESIWAGGVVGQGLRNGLLGMIKLAAGTVQALRIILRFRPDVIFLTGGYIAVPVSLSGWFWRVPLAVYLPDVQPGLAVRWSASLAERVMVTMPQSQKYFPSKRVTVTGYPLRQDIIRARRATRQEAREAFNLSLERPTVLVVGGSRGARSINRAALSHGPDWIEGGAQVLHVSGRLDWHTVQERRGKFAPETRKYYQIFPYLTDRMGLALRAADLAVARAGASCLGEFPVFGLPALLVPYPHAWRYQRENAEVLSECGAAKWIDDRDLKIQLGRTVGDLLENHGQLAEMSRQAAELAVPKAAERVATELIDMVAKSVS